MVQPKKSLKERITEEMTADYSNILEKNFDLAKQFIRILKEGKIEILFKDQLNGPEQISLYLLGKYYAKEANFVESENVDNKELMEELGISKNSLHPWLTQLRDQKIVKQVKNGVIRHTITANVIEKILTQIDKKIKREAI